MADRSNRVVRLSDNRARVEHVWREIEGAPPPPPGPDYETMGRLLATV